MSNQTIINEQMNQWKIQAAELQAQLKGFDLDEVDAHHEKVKELFVNLNAENAGTLRELLKSPLQSASEAKSDLRDINLYMNLEWSTNQPEKAHICLELNNDAGSLTVYAVK